MKMLLCLGLALAGCNKTEAPTDIPPPAKGANNVDGVTAVHGQMAPLRGQDVVAKVGGQPVLASEMMDKLQAVELKAESEYLGKLAQAREEVVRTYVMEKLLNAEAQKAGLASMEDWLKAEVEKNTKEPDEATLRALYAQLVPGGDPPYDMVRQQVLQAAMGKDRQKGLQSVVERVMADRRVEFTLPVPLLPKVAVTPDDDPSLGDNDARVTIIAFSDFECPYCSRVAPVVHDLVERNKGKVRVVFRDYPLSFHKSARPAAHAANCAHAQGKFWAFHDQLFKNQAGEGALEDKAFKTYARLVGLDGAKFDECLADSARYVAEIEKDVKDGERAGVEGTPTFFINQRLFTGNPSPEGFQAAIDNALKQNL